MKRISYNQMVIGLDKLFFTLPDSTQDQSETIEAYLEACGWDWNSVLNYMAQENEQAPSLPARISN